MRAGRPRVAVAPTKFEKAWPKGTRSEYEVLDLEDALARVYTTDAHLVTYIVDTPATHQPRLAKGSVADYPHRVTTSVLFCDVDNVDHAPWTDEARGRVFDVVESEGIYLTKAGYRLIQPLAEPVDVREAEGVLWAWFMSLEARGIAVDRACRDWTRHFRLPHVHRDGKPYRSPRVDLTRMRAVHIDAAQLPTKTQRPKQTHSPAILAPKEFAPAVDATLHPLATALGRSIARVQTEWHSLFLALAGALLERGIDAAELPALLRAVSVATGADSATFDREKAARSTVQARAEGRTVAGYGTLRRGWPGVADALDVALTPPAVPAADVAEVVTFPEDRWIPVHAIAAAPGTGKTHAAIELAERRAAKGTGHNTKTVMSFDKHRLVVQTFAEGRARGIPSARYFGALSVDGADACRMKAVALPLVEGGQSLWKLFCKPERGARCEHFDGCKARERAEGDDGARLVVGVHQQLSNLDAAAGSTGLLILDEPPSPLTQVSLEPKAMATALAIASMFEPAYGAAMSALVARIEAARKDSGELDLDALRAACPTGDVPPLSAFGRDFALRGHGNAARVGVASRVFRDVGHALRSDGGGIYIVPSGDTAKVVCAYPNPQLAKVLRRDGSTVLMSADVDLHLPGYLRLVGELQSEIPMKRFARADAVPVSRTWRRVKATKDHWRTSPQSLERAVEYALRWAAGRTLGIVTMKEHEERVRSLVNGNADSRVQVAHYGAMRGMNDWMALGAIATLGDPRRALDDISRESAFYGLPTEESELWRRADTLAGAELEQVFGRARTAWRTSPVAFLHVGQVRPRGFGWDAAGVDEDAGGRTAAVPADGEVDAMRALVAEKGRKGAAEALGMTVRGLEKKIARLTGQ